MKENSTKLFTNKRLFSSEKQDVTTGRDSKLTSIEPDQSIVLSDYSDSDSSDDPQSLTDRLNLHSISESLTEIQQTQIQDPEPPNLKSSLSLKHQINNSSDPYDGSQSENDSDEECLPPSRTPMVTSMPFTPSHTHTPTTPKDMSTSTTTPLLKKRNNFQRILATELLSKHKDNQHQHQQFQPKANFRTQLQIEFVVLTCCSCCTDDKHSVHPGKKHEKRIRPSKRKQVLSPIVQSPQIHSISQPTTPLGTQTRFPSLGQ